MIQYSVPIVLLALFASTASESTTAESTPVEDAIRELRIQIYDNYRLDRDEFNRRSELAAEAMRRLQTADDYEHQDILIWIAQSTRATQDRITFPPLPGSDFHFEEVADDVTDDTIDSIVESNPNTRVHRAGESVTVESRPVDNLAVSAETKGESHTQATSIVRTDKFGISPESRTFSILGSVGRAVTSAVAGGVGRGTATEVTEDAIPLDDPVTVEVPPVEPEIAAEIDAAPLAEETIEESFDISDEDLNLDELLLESPASEEPMAPTPETFQRES